MDAVEKDYDWNLFNRTELDKAAKLGRAAKFAKTLRARDLWEKLQMLPGLLLTLELNTTLQSMNGIPVRKMGRLMHLILALNTCS